MDIEERIKALEAQLGNQPQNRVYKTDPIPGSILPSALVATSTPAKGDLHYSDGSAFQNIPIGTSGQLLTVSQGVPSWSTLTNNYLSKVTVLSGTTPTLTCTGLQNIIFTLTLSGNTTYAITGATAGQVLMVEATQGAGTTYTNTWFAGVTWVTLGSTAPVQTTTTNGVTTYGFRVLTSSTFLGYLIGTQ